MSDSLTRRDFAGLLAAGSVLSTAGNAAVADDKPAADAKPAAPADLLLDLVKQKYPHERLDEAALDEIRSDLQHFWGRSKRLSDFALKNGDEPGFVFSAWRADFPPR